MRPLDEDLAACGHRLLHIRIALADREKNRGAARLIGG
jgi:hypothetical protein